MRFSAYINPKSSPVKPCVNWKNGTLGDLLSKIEFLIINALGNSLAMRSVNLKSSEDKNARQFDTKKTKTMTTDFLYLFYPLKNSHRN